MTFGRPAGLRLGRIQLGVRDVERAARFYTQVLGLRVTRRLPNLLWLSCPGMAGHDIALHATGADTPLPPRGGAGSIGFEAANPRELAELVDRAAGSGARVMMVEHGSTWSIHTSDPDGNEIEIYCHAGQLVSPRPASAARGRLLPIDELRAAAAAGKGLTAPA